MASSPNRAGRRNQKDDNHDSYDALTPTVLPTPPSISALLSHLLSLSGIDLPASNATDVPPRPDSTSSESNLTILCTTRPHFLQRILHTLTEDASKSLNPHLPADYILNPTLGLLSLLSRDHGGHRLVFCPDVPTLRAFLSSVSCRRRHTSTSRKKPRAGNSARLTLVNAMALHRGTASFSVQGVSRSLALAVEAARQSESRLMLVEVEGWDLGTWAQEAGNDEEDEAEEMLMGERFGDDIGDEIDAGGGGGGGQDVWTERVPVLDSVIARRILGKANPRDRLWMEKTVSIGSLVAQWARFERPDYWKAVPPEE